MSPDANRYAGEPGRKGDRIVAEMWRGLCWANPRPAMTNARCLSPNPALAQMM